MRDEVIARHLAERVDSGVHIDTFNALVAIVAADVERARFSIELNEDLHCDRVSAAARTRLKAIGITAETFAEPVTEADWIAFVKGVAESACVPMWMKEDAAALLRRKGG